MEDHAWLSPVHDFFVISRADIQVGTPANVLAGVFLAAESLSDLALYPVLLYLALAVMTVTFASNINCLYDIPVDRRYKKYLSDAVLSLGKPRVKVLIVAEGLAIAALIFLLYRAGHMVTAVLAVAGVFLAVLYSKPPWRVKKRGVLSPFPVFVGMYLLLPLGGWLLLRWDVPCFMVVFVGSYFLMNSGFILVNVAEDYLEDRREHIVTWAHLLGPGRTMQLAFVFATAGLGCVGVAGYRLAWQGRGLSPGNAAAVVLLVLVLVALLRALADIWSAARGNVVAKAKRCARAIPRWFATVRYPLVAALFFMLLP